MIGKMGKAKPRRGKKPSDKVSDGSKGDVLQNIGLGWKQASRLESMARVPDEQFEELASAEKASAV